MKRKVSTEEPKATKTAHFNVPAPQRERIAKKFIEGQCIRKISREEHRSRGTVSRIVNSSEVRNYVLEIRSAYYGLGREALDAVRRALRTSKDGKIAYQLLADIGVVPNQEDRQPLNGTLENDEGADVQKQMALLLQCAVERSLLYRTPLGGIRRVARIRLFAARFPILRMRKAIRAIQKRSRNAGKA